MTAHYDTHGIAYQTWSNVARKLAWNTNDAIKAWDELEHSFMTPQIERFQTHPDAEYLEWMGEDANQPGFYHRLSANGYMDCTDWSGPFQNVEDAMVDLLSQYVD